MCVLVCSEKILKEGTGRCQDYLVRTNLILILKSQGDISIVLFLSKGTKWCSDVILEINSLQTESQADSIHYSLNPALYSHSTKVNRAFGPARSFSIVNPRGRQLKARLYSSELSYRASVASPSPAKVLPYWEFCTVLRGGGPPLKTVQKICCPRMPDFLYSFEGGGVLWGLN